MGKYRSIAIDGPSGSGKSSLAKNLAIKTGFNYLDTGALYRTVGLYVREKNIDPYDAKAVNSLLPGLKIAVEYRGNKQHMLLFGADVTEKIRENDISLFASAVSKIPEVRAALYDLQRKTAENGDIIMDGRDIGTVILPGADVKIFLTASPEKRAERRFEELVAAGQNVTYEKILEDINKRDNQDQNRGTAPLKMAEDAYLLDNSAFPAPEMTLSAALKIIKEKLPDVRIR